MIVDGCTHPSNVVSKSHITFPPCLWSNGHKGKEISGEYDKNKQIIPNQTYFVVVI